MTDTNKLKELADLASKVAPGPWQVDQLSVTADTRAQVCCGRAYMECCGEPAIDGEEFDPVCSATSETLADFIASANPQVVLELFQRLERAEVEIQACASALPYTHYMDPPGGGDVSIPEQLRRMAKDAEVHREIQNAARDLPDAWSIQICIEQGAGWIDLFDEEGNRVEFEDFCENIALSVKNAVQHAIDAALEGGGR